MNRIPSDHASIESVRAQVVRHGGGRGRLEIPNGVLPDADGMMRVVIDEEIRFGSIVTNAGEEDDWLTGVYDSPRLARSGSGENALDQWLEDHDRSIGSSVHVDIITHGYAIGLRAPGDRELYPSVESPSSSLDAIARSLEDSE